MVCYKCNAKLTLLLCKFVYALDISIVQLESCDSLTHWLNKQSHGTYMSLKLFPWQLGAYIYACATIHLNQFWKGIEICLEFFIFWLTRLVSSAKRSICKSTVSTCGNFFHNRFTKENIFCRQVEKISLAYLTLVKGKFSEDYLQLLCCRSNSSLSSIGTKFIPL